jgi:Aldehyde dehydrogenase family
MARPAGKHGKCVMPPNYLSAIISTVCNRLERDDSPATPSGRSRAPAGAHQGAGGIPAARGSGPPSGGRAAADPHPAGARQRAGQVEVNGGAWNVAVPFGGFGQSGYGRELGSYGLEEYLEVKALQF